MAEKRAIGEQVVNKMVETAIASRLKGADKLEVRIKTDLNKLAKGQLDAIAIKINGLLMHHNLRAEEFDLRIGEVAVKPLSALRGKIKLVHPSEGTLQVIVDQASLAAALNTELLQEMVRSQPQSEESPGATLSSMTCVLSEGTILFSTELKNGEVNQPITLVATPQVVSEGQGIELQNVSYVEGQEPSVHFTTALLDQAIEILSLQDLERQGTSLNIQQLEVAAGKLTLQAKAHIGYFPSS